MYLADTEDAVTYVSGWLAGAFPENACFRRWNAWANATLGAPDKLIWTWALRSTHPNQAKREAVLIDLMTAFAEGVHRDGWSVDLPAIRRPVSGSPEHVLGSFLRGMVRSEDLRPLVLPSVRTHPRLRNMGYPHDVREALLQTLADERCVRIPTTDDDHVRLLCGAFIAPVDLHRIDGCWLVDAAPLIASFRGE
jgi:hypothetical protein